MKPQVQGALLIVALLYLIWAFAFLVMPEQATAMMSTGPHNPALAAMFAASLFAFGTMFLVAAHEPSREIVHASAVALGFIGATAAIQMLSKGMPASLMTVVSLIINLGAAVYLFISLTDAAMSMAGGGRGKTRARAKGARRTRRTTRRRATA